jgi:hypothetical protein
MVRFSVHCNLSVQSLYYIYDFYKMRQIPTLMIFYFSHLQAAAVGSAQLAA